MLIEIKGSNPWYKKDLLSGKLNAKNNAALQFANSNGMTFNFILNNIDAFFNELLKY